MTLELFYIGGIVLCMSIVTTICGGGSMFGVPLLLLLGIPPLEVMAVNRTADTNSYIGAFKKFHKGKKIVWKHVPETLILITVGGLLGVQFLRFMTEKSLYILALCASIIGLIVFLTIQKKKAIGYLPRPLLRLYLFFCGIYSSAIGIAGATFATIGIITRFKISEVESRGVQIASALPEALITTVSLIYMTSIHPSKLVVTIIAGLLGGHIGASLTLGAKGKQIRQAIITMSILAIGGLTYKIMRL